MAFNESEALRFPGDAMGALGRLDWSADLKVPRGHSVWQKTESFDTEHRISAIAVSEDTARLFSVLRLSSYPAPEKQDPFLTGDHGETGRWYSQYPWHFFASRSP